ncbi:MAG: hypothetical protein J0H69_19640 [Burkholderiales bacterium]|nr:hypothetical protein [Burkholderiales bacterium]
MNRLFTRPGGLRVDTRQPLPLEGPFVSVKVRRRRRIALVCAIAVLLPVLTATLIAWLQA